MSSQLDPYSVSDNLRRLADNLMSDVTSLTVNDIADALIEAAEFITDFADDHYSYASRQRITLNVGNESVDITDDIMPLVNTHFVHSWVRNAIMSYSGDPF